MKNPPIQRQHKIPIVYLKTFAIDRNSNQKKICVLIGGESFSRKKNIESFYRHENFFDIESDNPRIERVFEEMNGLLETNYNNILKELETKQSLSDKYTAYLLQFAANLICRSDVWREMVTHLLNSDVKSVFIKHMIAHTLPEEEVINNFDNNELYIKLNELPTDKCINRILMFFSSHLWERLCHYEITFFKAHSDKGWFTSDNPVVMDNEPDGMEMLPPDSVLYFPLTPEYLAFIHYPKSKDKSNAFRKYKFNTVNEINDEEMDVLTKTILRNAGSCVICPFDFNYRKEK